MPAVTRDILKRDTIVLFTSTGFCRRRHRRSLRRVLYMDPFCIFFPLVILVKLLPLAKSSSIKDYKRFIVVICDLGNNHLIPLYWLFAFVAVNSDQDESLHIDMCSIFFLWTMLVQEPNRHGQHGEIKRHFLFFGGETRQA
jgi:hypothetical protein